MTVAVINPLWKSKSQSMPPITEASSESAEVEQSRLTATTSYPMAAIQHLSNGCYSATKSYSSGLGSCGPWWSGSAPTCWTTSRVTTCGPLAAAPGTETPRVTYLRASATNARRDAFPVWVEASTLCGPGVSIWSWNCRGSGGGVSGPALAGGIPLTADGGVLLCASGVEGLPLAAGGGVLGLSLIHI